MIAYLDHVEEQGELDLEAATEFLVLIASLLELKSRLLLPAPEEDEIELGPEEAAEELLARMLEYRRYRDAAAHLAELHADGHRYLYRSAPLPPELRRVALDAAEPAYEPERLAVAIGDLLRVPPAPDTSHIRPTVSLDKRLRVLRELLLGRGSIDFDDAFGEEDKLTQAVTLFALLELLQARRGDVGAEGRIRADRGRTRRSARLRYASGGDRVSSMTLEQTVEALLFLSPEPVSHRRARRGVRGE